MPNKVNFNRGILLEEAFEILRQKWIAAFTARSIGRNLGCSTQPVYSTFGSMRNLREALFDKAREYAVSFLLRDQGEENSFLSIGMQYFRLARAEKHLFRWLFLDGERAMDLETMSEFSGPLIERMKQEEHIRNLGDKSISRIGRDMWIYAHGLVLFSYESDLSDCEDLVRSQLNRMGRTVIAWERVQAGISDRSFDGQ